MASSNGRPNLDEYVDVASRIRQFYEQHPEGAIRPFNPDKPFELITVGTETFVVMSVAVYRHAADKTPAGVGTAQEPFPGKTPYTRNSEIQNCETSAIGRAIVAAGAADTRKGISSAEEIRNRVAEREQQATNGHPAAVQATQAVPISDGTVKQICIALKGVGVDTHEARVHALSAIVGHQVGSTKDLTAREAVHVLDRIAARRRDMAKANGTPVLAGVNGSAR